MRNAIALSVLVVSLAMAQQSEIEAWNEVTKDINNVNFKKALDDLDLWKQKYADSTYKNDRDALYVQVYAATNQPAKALDTATPLIRGDLAAKFSGAAGQPTILRLLYNAAWAISRIPDPDPNEITTGDKAARELLAWDQPLPGVPTAKWEEAKTDMQAKASAALLYLAMLPGVRAMTKQPPDCEAAETAYTKALNIYPDKSVVSWELARALTCEAKQMPAKVNAAIYEFERAAMIDPTLGGARSDPKQVRSFADNTYIKFHGSDEGLEQIRQQAKRLPLPPADFTIQSADDVAEAKRKAFAEAHPQIALWMTIKDALSQPNGEQYFNDELKGSGVPQLTGELIEAKPACRPRELLVAVSTPDANQPVIPEIRLKLDKPLAGKPEPGTEFHWQGVPSAFSAKPFLLTMDAETTGIEGLKTAPCGVRR